MISLALALILAPSGPDVATLDALAQKRDVRALTPYLTSESTKPLNPLLVISTNGAYATGRFGWHALDLNPPGGGASYVVFSTPLTSEDIGEMVFERTGDRLRYVPEDQDLGVRIASHAFDVQFDIPSKRVAITDRMVVKKSGPTKTHFLFRMSPYMKVESVNGGKVPFAQAGGVTMLPMFGGDTSTFEVKYSGVVDMPGYAGSITTNEAQLTNDYWYPMIARYPAPYTINVKAPQDWKVIGQGEETGQGSYRMDLPVVYYSLSAGPYKTATTSDGPRKLFAWSQILNEEKLKYQTEINRTIIDFYSKTFAPLPFSRFGALITKLYEDGALEAYSYATYSPGWLPAEDPHEPAHTWWGGMINNTYLHSMWNESFAVFCEGLYSRNVQIGSPEERKLAYVKDARPSPPYLTAPVASGSPWYGGAASSLGYGKGGDVMQMLEVELGTETMIKTMRQWLQDQPKGKPGEWEDYERVVNKVTGKDYKWFFDQWLRRTGWAKFEVSQVKWQNGQITGLVHHTGTPYKINAEALLEFPNGKREIVKFNTMETPHAEDYTFKIKCPEKPILFSVDPWRRILREQHPDERPAMLDGALDEMQRFTDPKHKEYLPGLGEGAIPALPSDLNGIFIVGSPETLPAMAPLCAKAGFQVTGNRLVYKNMTVDLRECGAVALVDLGQGKRCAIGLGTFKVRPDFGRARLVVFDPYGRFLRGITEPKRSGWMTFRFGRKDQTSGKGA